MDSPAPEGPTSAVIPPGGIWKLISSRTRHPVAGVVERHEVKRHGQAVFLCGLRCPVM